MREEWIEICRGFAAPARRRSSPPVREEWIEIYPALEAMGVQAVSSRAGGVD